MIDLAERVGRVGAGVQPFDRSLVHLAAWLPELDAAAAHYREAEDRLRYALAARRAATGSESTQVGSRSDGTAGSGVGDYGDA